MMQGTTPTHTWELPIGVEMVAKARVTYKQDDTVVLTKEGADCQTGATDGGAAVSCTLTQEDTLKLDHRKQVKIQLQILTPGGQAMETPVYYRSVGECLAGVELV